MCPVVSSWAGPCWKGACILIFIGVRNVVSCVQRTNPREYKKRGIFETVYEVEHVTGWSILWLSGEFITKLRVAENRGSKSVTFKLIKSDVMEDFDGSWKLQPYTQAGMNKMFGKGGNPLEGIVGTQCLHHLAPLNCT